MNESNHQPIAAAHLRAFFEVTFGSPPAVIARAPGRIEFIGNHTDYNGGTVLGASIDRGVWVALAPRSDGARRFRSGYEGRVVEVPPGPGGAKNRPRGLGELSPRRPRGPARLRPARAGWIRVRGPFQICRPARASSSSARAGAGLGPRLPRGGPG